MDFCDAYNHFNNPLKRQNKTLQYARYMKSISAASDQPLRATWAKTATPT